MNLDLVKKLSSTPLPAKRPVSDMHKRYLAARVVKAVADLESATGETVTLASDLVAQAPPPPPNAPAPESPPAIVLPSSVPPTPIQGVDARITAACKATGAQTPAKLALIQRRDRITANLPNLSGISRQCALSKIAELNKKITSK